MINISNQSPCCLSICEQFFRWNGEIAELGLEAVVRNAGGEATENEAPSRYTGAAEPRHTEANAAHSVPPGLETRSGGSRGAGGHLPHVAREARRTVDAGEQRDHGAVAKSKEGQRPPGDPHAHGWAAMMTAMTTDPALSAADKQKVVTYTSSANSLETLLQSIKTFQKDWVKWQCSVDSQTQPI